VLAVELHEPDEFFQFSGAPGFDREILEGFARLNGVRLEPLPIAAWDDLVPALVAGRGDVVAGRFTVTEERRRRIAFTRETFPTRNVVLTRQPTPPVRSLEELRELRVGPITVANVRAAVSDGRTEESLLGVSFLGRLASYTVSGSTLTLTGPP